MTDDYRKGYRDGFEAAERLIDEIAEHYAHNLYLPMAAKALQMAAESLQALKEKNAATI